MHKRASPLYLAPGGLDDIIGSSGGGGLRPVPLGPKMPDAARMFARTRGGGALRSAMLDLDTAAEGADRAAADGPADHNARLPLASANAGASKPPPIKRSYFPETWLWRSARAEYVRVHCSLVPLWATGYLFPSARV